MNDAVYADTLLADFDVPPICQGATSVAGFMQAHPEAIWQQDNAPPHTSGSIQSMLRVWQRLSFWPPGSPDYNPIELVWGTMKKVLAARHFHSMEELRTNIRMEWAHQTHPLQFRKYIDRVLSNMEKSRAVGYRTVH